MLKWILSSVVLLGLSFLSVRFLKSNDYEFWVAPPAKKFEISIKRDLSHLLSTNALPKEWSEIALFEIKTDASPAQDWISEKVLNISKNEKGKFKLQVFVSLWIEGSRYGTLVQYDLVDLKTKNTVWETNRNYKLGIVY